MCIPEGRVNRSCFQTPSPFQSLGGLYSIFQALTLVLYMLQWGMFPCGHALCLECADTLINNKCSRSPQVACPLCRERCATSDVNYVRLGNDADCGDETEEAEPVFGAHASKIVSVTQCLLRIQRKEPGAKAIVFSVVSP